ncbi:TetR/AcrR family transcriptional regulator [Streptomyces hokutonensis]|uniref:TetR/AcrR family transcriptional regulator n=1 Tax=Streptomyces hokutonensis TaxID=1306990 RepID=UPI0037F23FE9
MHPEAGAAPRRRHRLTLEREGQLYAVVLDELRGSGYDVLTMDAIAAQSRCSKATLYRKWQGKPQLVAAALRHSFRLAPLDAGSLADDLYELTRRISDTRDVELARIIGPACDKNADLAEALHEAIVQPVLDLLRQIIERAVARGELEPNNPTAEFLPHMISGAVFARPFIERCEADAEYLKRYMDNVVLPALVRN